MLQVYADPCTINCRKVLAGFDLMGTKYELNNVNFFTGEHKKPPYLAINPCGTVPAAADGDCIITESNAILQYAADLDGRDEFYPKDLKQRALVNRWLLWEASVWFGSCYVYIVEFVVKPLLGAQPDQSVIDAQASRWNELAGILDAQLAKTMWLAGDHVTIADIAVAAPMHLHAAQRLPLEKYPNLTRWLTEGVEKLPSWQKTQGAVNKALLPEPSTNGNSNAVQAIFNYTRDVDEKTEIYFYEHELADSAHAPGDDPHLMDVTNGWDRAADFSVDKEGFALREFKTDYGAWEDEDGVRSKFYPEVVEFLKKTTGAKKVLVFDHTIRTKVNDTKKITDETKTSQRAPVMLVHCDYTSESAPLRVQQLLPDEAEDLLSRRVAFFNVWKPVRHVVEERPLAMCDITSTQQDDFFKLFLRYRDRVGENYVLRHSPAHKWWYFPKMNTDQVIILKTYDSDNDRARFVGHSAFDDPTSPADAAVRESVEIRTIAFF